MVIVGATDIGLSRAENQDDFAYKVLSENAGFALVCDGMGGANGGSVASRIASHLIAERIVQAYRPEMSGNSAENVLESAVAAANVEIFDKAAQDTGLVGMGTTLVGGILLRDAMHIVHVGDSRAYHYRDGVLQQITTDHSYVQDMIDKGQLTPEQARLDPRKHIITRALGVENEIQADFDIVMPVQEKDLFLFCSDGLTNMVELDDIQKLLETTELEALPQRLVAEANANGGADNITVVIMMQD